MGLLNESDPGSDSPHGILGSASLAARGRYREKEVRRQGKNVKKADIALPGGTTP